MICKVVRAKFVWPWAAVRLLEVQKIASLQSLFPTCRRLGFSATRNLTTASSSTPISLWGKKKRGNRLLVVRFQTRTFQSTSTESALADCKTPGPLALIAGVWMAYGSRSEVRRRTALLSVSSGLPRVQPGRFRNCPRILTIPFNFMLLSTAGGRYGDKSRTH